MRAELDLARRAHALLTRAMELEPARRRDFVRAECSADEPLARRVLDLLDAADRSERFLDRPLLDGSSDDGSQIPDAVGDYLVVGVLGVGGMATVYEAIQDHPKRRVALKVMHQGVTRSEAYARFRFETEALARLHHPGIAQIYEAGAAQIGQPAPAPFFAMELVPDAVPITTYADRQKLTPRERLVMLAAVCDAVHHGHQHGIIHRDLKPGNVLVGGEGHAKVIDFGVARTTDAGAESLTNAMGVPQLVGTLNYMSPEQCGAGNEIDIRTDVYSLGVMLYELICGRMPYDLKDLPLPAALQAISQRPPNRPELRHPRGRDLEAIILKAIEKDPARRYDSASALAADLRRFLNNEAIEARPPTVIDQCRLFAWRNRVLVGVGLVVLASIILLATISTAFAVRVANEMGLRRAAQQRITKERDAALWRAYTAQIAGALSAMNTGEFQQMRSRLAEATHEPRGWEWGFLSRLAETSAGTINASDNMVMDMAVTADWKRIATAAAEGTIRLWNVADGARLAEFKSSTGARAMSIDFTFDDRYVVTGDTEGVIRLLDAANLHEVRRLTDLGDIRSVLGLPGDRIAVGAVNGNAVIWSLETRETVVFAGDQPGGASGMALSDDGKLLATYNDTGQVWIRRADDLSVINRLDFPGSVSEVRFSHDGRIGAAGAGGRLLVWSSDGALLHDLKATPGVNTVRSLAFSNDGKLIAAGLIHRCILLVSSEDGRILGETGGHTEAVSALAFRADDQLLISSSWDGTVRTWRTSEIGTPSGMVALKGHQNHVMDLAFSPDGSVVASASRDGSLMLWDADLAQPIARFDDERGELSAVAFSPDGRLVAAVGASGGVNIRSAYTGLIVEQLVGEGGGVYSTIAFDAASRRVAVGAQNGSVLVWTLGKPEPDLVITGHTARVNSVAFSPDGSLIASGSRDRGVRLRDSRTGAEVAGWMDHQLDVFAVLFSQDGRRLYSGSRDQTIRVWDVQKRVSVATLAGHGQYVTSLALNPDGTRLAAGSWFGEIVLFDVPTLDLIASFRAHDSAIRGVAFSPDGRWLGSASYDSTIKLFDSATRAEADAARARAMTSLSAARDKVAPLFEHAPDNPDALLNRLSAAGLDPATDPWIRKAVLDEVASKKDNP